MFLFKQRFLFLFNGNRCINDRLNSYLLVLEHLLCNSLESLVNLTIVNLERVVANLFNLSPILFKSQFDHFLLYLLLLLLLLFFNNWLSLLFHIIKVYRVYTQLFQQLLGLLAMELNANWVNFRYFGSRLLLR